MAASTDIPRGVSTCYRCGLSREQHHRVADYDDLSGNFFDLCPTATFHGPALTRVLVVDASAPLSAMEDGRVRQLWELEEEAHREKYRHVAMHVDLATYKHPTDTRVFFQNSRGYASEW